MGASPYINASLQGNAVVIVREGGVVDLKIARIGHISWPPQSKYASRTSKLLRHYIEARLPKIIDAILSLGAIRFYKAIRLPSLNSACTPV